MRGPLVPVAACYAVGILLAEFFPLPGPALLGWSFVLLLSCLGWEKRRPLWLGLLVACCGATNLSLQTQSLSPLDLRNVVGTNVHWTTLTGALPETPTLREADPQGPGTVRSLARLRVTSADLQGNPVPVLGDVMVSTSGVLPAEFCAGQQVRVTGVLMPPRPPAGPGLFDYGAHLARQRIYHLLQVDSVNDWQALSARPPPVTDRFIAWASRTLARGLPAADEELRLNWAMVLGWRTALTGEVATPFMRSGTMHIFAISGLHIALIAGILVAVFRAVRVPRIACGAAVIPLLWFYTAATGWQSSAIRSTIMMTVILGGWALNRPSDLINSLAVAALAILVWQPQQIFMPGFQLSFFVVLSIALLVPGLQARVAGWLKTDPFLPRELLPRWRRWSATPLRWLTASGATSLAAWLGSLPLTACYFHLFSPITLLANGLIVPLSTLALASALGSLACGAWCPPLTELFNHSAWLWMHCMIKVSAGMTTLPAAYAYVAPPPAWLLLAYYPVLFGCLSGRLLTPTWRPWTALGGVVILTAAVLDWRERQSTFQLTLLPVNGGLAVHLDAPGRALDTLIDCGDSNAVAHVTVPFLRAHGVNRLPNLILTHGDVREVGGMPLLATEIPVSRTFTSAQHFRSSSYREILHWLEANTSPPTRLNCGDVVGHWEVLHPSGQGRFAQADDAAIVLLGRFHATRVLLLSDLGRAGQVALLQSTNDLRAEIVVCGLPARSEPLGQALLARVQPRLIIVADADYPVSARAPESLRRRLRGTAPEVLFTREVGPVTLRLGPEHWERTVARPSVAVTATQVVSSKPPD